ncbi:AI-2E family transporter [Salinarimonas soli]|uniref:AI-2E family transporter n=1 Tax=Salinarimonas soli TaxID=1638099 RepID=A0A5B2V8L8_9HYPH|nr:AI-2E family transporter [Salinarimonas soli]KAA2235321.1 AI-2E family transporter [Salinarimonas soli]
MTIQKQVGFWIAALVVFALGLWLLRDVLLPFVAGLALAYLLDPLADRLERLGLGRLGATLLILGLFVLGFVLVLFLLAPLVAGQVGSFVANLPAYAARLQRLALDYGQPIVERLGGPQSLRDVEASVGDLVSQGAGWLTAFLRSLWSGGQALVSIVALLVVTPVVAFYLLIDWDHMVEAVDSWLPRPHQATIRELFVEINAAIAGFIRGQTAVCLILGTFYAIGLSVLGLNFGVLIGLSAGLLSFIPYVGSLTGLLLSVGVAIVQFWPDGLMVAATLGVFVFGQFVEGNILSPKLVGASVGLHPVWLMFALLAFGSLFGFVGLLLAVPLAAAAGVLARFALRRYLASSLYSGAPRSIAGHEPALITDVRAAGDA